MKITRWLAERTAERAYAIHVYLDEYGYMREDDPMEAIVDETGGVVIFRPWRTEPERRIRASTLSAAMATLDAGRGAIME